MGRVPEEVEGELDPRKGRVCWQEMKRESVGVGGRGGIASPDKEGEVVG